MNFQEARLLTRKISLQLSREIPGLLLRAGKDLEGRMKRRIFNQGKNSAGSPIGKYTSKWWMKQRKDGGKFSPGGRQIRYVDLQNKGDLFRSFQVAKDGQGAAMVVLDDEDFKKAKGQELIQGRKQKKDEMPIFDPTSQEVTSVQKYVDDLIEEALDEIVK